MKWIKFCCWIINKYTLWKHNNIKCVELEVNAVCSRNFTGSSLLLSLKLPVINDATRNIILRRPVARHLLFNECYWFACSHATRPPRSCLKVSYIHSMLLADLIWKLVYIAPHVSTDTGHHLPPLLKNAALVQRLPREEIRHAHSFLSSPSYGRTTLTFLHV
jgi:hypothetical protein